MAFPSVYEMTNPLTTVRKQHFWEYFSGADYTVITTKTYNQADTSQVSTRSLYSNPTVSNGEGERVAVRVDAGHSAIGTTVNKVKVHIARRGTLSGNYEVTIRDGSDTILASASATANNVSTSYSTVELTLDNYVEMRAGYRVCIEYDSTARLADGLDFGTSSSAWESNITQQLYSTAGGWINDPDGAGAGRKFMFTFDSTPATSVLPPYRWTFTDVTGSGTFAMADSVDGGFSVQSATSGYAKSAIYFNNKRQFKGGGSVCIGSMKNSVAGGGAYGYMGLSKVGYDTADYAYMGKPDNANNTNFVLATSSGSSPETTANASTTVTQDTSFHTFKMVLSASNVVGTIDGVLASTNSTSIPTETEKLQPTVLNMNNNSGSGNVTSIRYMECYNT